MHVGVPFILMALGSTMLNLLWDTTYDNSPYVHTYMHGMHEINIKG